MISCSETLTRLPVTIAFVASMAPVAENAHPLPISTWFRTPKSFQWKKKIKNCSFRN